MIFTDGRIRADIFVEASNGEPSIGLPAQQIGQAVSKFERGRLLDANFQIFRVHIFQVGIGDGVFDLKSLLFICVCSDHVIDRVGGTGQ